VTADGTGHWTYTTATLADGSHSLTASASSSSGQTTASSALKVTVDTVAPTAPTITSSDVVNGVTKVDHLTFTGAAEANSTVKIFDGTTQIGTATADSKGAWSYAASNLATGNHSFTATDMDAAGNTSAASSKLAVTVDSSTAPTTHQATFTDVTKAWSGNVTLKGTADANSQVKLYDGSTALGSVKADAQGNWSFTSKTGVWDTTHDFSAKTVDASGNLVDGSGHAVLGTWGGTVTSTGGNDLLVASGGQDTFVFGANFGHDVVKGFQASGASHDIVQFSKSVFDNFADVLSHATASGGDVVITATTGDTLTLKNTKLAALDKGDFHFA